MLNMKGLDKCCIGWVKFGHLDFQINLKFHKFTCGIWFDRNRLKVIKFEQVGPDICHFIDLSLAIGGHLGNMQIKNCHLVKFSTPGGNDDSSLY